MGLRQSTSDSHNAWFCSSQKKTGHANRGRDLASHGFVRSSKWFDPRSSFTTNAVPHSEVNSVEFYQAHGDLTAELGDISATTFSRGSGQTPDREEVYNSFSRAEYTPTKVANVNELGIALRTASRALYDWDTLPNEILSRGAEKSKQNHITTATPGHKIGVAIRDVDGFRTSPLSSKKRRLRLQFVTSKLSRPFPSLATHTLDRSTNKDTPAIYESAKSIIPGARKAMHQTTLVRKAAVLISVRSNAQDTADTQGQDSIWRMTRLAVTSHGLQLVTDSTGAIFPDRPEKHVLEPTVPRRWQPHTIAPAPVVSSASASDTRSKGLAKPEQQPQPEFTICCSTLLPPTSIMTPLAGAGEDEVSFPNADLDSRYHDTSDEDAVGVYADFGVLFGSRADSLDGAEEDENYYEEYLDEVKNIICSS